MRFKDGSLYGLDIDWTLQSLVGPIPPLIGALYSADTSFPPLQRLSLSRNDLEGAIPAELGKLVHLKSLNLSHNKLSGPLPLSLTKLTNLQTLDLSYNNGLPWVWNGKFSGAGWWSRSHSHSDQEYVERSADAAQAALYAFLLRPAQLRMLDMGREVTKGRVSASMSSSSLSDAEQGRENMKSAFRADGAVCPFFSFLVENDDLRDVIMSYLDPLHCCIKDRNAVLKCWKKMGGKEETLRNWAGSGGRMDDVSKFRCVTVEGGRVTGLRWAGLGLSGTIPAEIEALSALTVLSLYRNNLSGKLTPELSNLTSLTDLRLSHNAFSGAVPSSLAKLTNLVSLSLHNNKFTTDVPASFISFCKDNSANKVQSYLAMLAQKKKTKKLASPPSTSSLTLPLLLLLSLLTRLPTTHSLLYSHPTSYPSRLRIIPVVHSSSPSMSRVSSHLPSNTTVVLELDRERWKAASTDTEFKCWPPTRQKVILGDYPTSHITSRLSKSWRERPPLIYTISNLLHVTTLPNTPLERLTFLLPTLIPLSVVLLRPYLLLLALPLIHLFLSLVVYPRDERMFEVARGELEYNDVDVICGAAHAYGIGRRLEEEGWRMTEEN